jgi:hypothetical protein
MASAFRWALRPERAGFARLVSEARSISLVLAVVAGAGGGCAPSHTNRVPATGVVHTGITNTRLEPARVTLRLIRTSLDTTLFSGLVPSAWRDGVLVTPAPSLDSTYRMGLGDYRVVAIDPVSGVQRDQVIQLISRVWVDVALNREGLDLAVRDSLGVKY